MNEYGSVTQCPHCKTSFHVGPIQLEAANGHVRCGGCLKVFDARDHFVIEQKPLFESADELVQEPDNDINIIPEKFDTEDGLGQELADQPIEETDAIELNAQDAIYLGCDAPNETVEGHSEALAEEISDLEGEDDEFIYIAAEPEEVEEELDEMLEEAFDEFEDDLAARNDAEFTEKEDYLQPLIAERTGTGVEEPILLKRADLHEDEELAEQLFVDSEKRRTHKKPSAPWVICATMLFVALFAQTLYWQPSTLRKSTLYNQVSLNYCALLPCRELVLEDLSQLYITGLVRPSNQYNNALSVQVELRNRADLAQRFPHIELAFTDLRGQKISLRRFAPEEYLRAETSGRTLLEPFQRIQIELELYDPGASAISYEFNLLYIN